MSRNYTNQQKPKSIACSMQTSLKDRIFSSVTKFLSSEKNLIALSIIFGVLLTLIIYTKVYSDGINNGLSGEVIRFHVLADSDGDEDQKVKLLVRDGIIRLLQPELEDSQSLSQSKEAITHRLKDIEKAANAIIAENGMNYTAKAMIQRAFFPTRVYGSVTLPAGEYEALRVELGKAGGANWWCVMFPPLCYVDASVKLPEDVDAQLKTVFSQEEYSILTSGDSKAVTPKVKLKLVEWWQNRKKNKKR